MITTQGVGNKKRKLKHYPSNKFARFRNVKQTNKKKAFIVKYLFSDKKRYVKNDYIKHKT